MSLKDESKIIEVKDFYSRVLNNKRSLYVYLPPGYSREDERFYPVLYMQDGQNIFSGDTSYSGSGWEIHRIAEDLLGKGRLPELIIVGIAHQNEERLSEYAHWDGRFQGNTVNGRGHLYEKFLIEEVKPYIEAHLRVLKGPENTGIMGSSMGGLVSFIIALHNPEIFGKAGVVSPSFWWGENGAANIIKKLKKSIPIKLWLDMGQAEGGFSLGFDKVLEAIRGYRTIDEKNMAVWLVPEAIHSEVDWMHRVHCPLLYLFGEIGHPEKIVINGRRVIALKEKAYGPDVTAVFNTGFAITAKGVVFESANREILRINENEELIPIACGSTVIEGKWMGLSAGKAFTVVPRLSSKVKVEIYVRVPKNLVEEIFKDPLKDPPESLYMGVGGPRDYPLEKRGNTYQGTLMLDRDSVLSYKITRGTWNRVEKDSGGLDIPSRRLVAREDMRVQIEVEGW